MAYTLPDMMIKNLINKEIDSIITTDYEEGVFTPVFTPESGVIASMGTAQARYTKIGNQVFISLRVNIADKGTGAGSLVLTGLPFIPLLTTVANVFVGFLNYNGVGIVNTSGTVVLYKYDGSTIILNGTHYVNFVYTIA